MKKILKYFTKLKVNQSDLKSYNGFKRQEALDHFQYPRPVDLSLLIERLNDWVAPVRQSALSSIKTYMVDEMVNHFIDCLPQINHLEKCARNNNIKVVDEIHRFILSSTTNKLNQLLRCGVPQRREYFKLLLENNALSKGELHYGLDCNDQNIQQNIAKKLGALIVGYGKGVFENHKSFYIRKALLYYKVEQGVGEEELVSALLDKSAAIRYIAYYHLDSSGFNFNIFTKDLFKKPDNQSLVVAIWLARKQRDFRDEVKLQLNSSVIYVRNAAINAYQSLSFDQLGLEELISIYQGSGQPVYKVVAKLVKRIDELVDLKIYIDCVQNYPKHNWSFLFEKLLIWDKLIAIFLTNSINEDYSLEFSNKFYSAITPTIEQIESLNELLLEPQYKTFTLDKNLDHMLKVHGVIID